MARIQNIFPDEQGNLRCSTCLEYKIPSDFNKAASMKRGYLYNCRVCEKTRMAAVMLTDEGKDSMRERVRKYSLLKKYGLTVDEYNSMRINQEYSCAICGKDEDDNDGRILAVDHDHITGKNRGLLCQKCNIGLGHFEDDVIVMRSAIKYISNGGFVFE